MDRRTSILVLCRDGWEDTRRCLEAVRLRTRPGSYELLVFDNASSDGTHDRLAALSEGWAELRVFRNERNLSFAEGVNRGMRLARGDAFLWLNNDTVPGEGWLDGLLAAAGPEGVGAAGPVTDNMAPPRQIAAPGGGTEDADFLGGFCFLLKRSAAERAGLLDERFEWGWEDMDYCLRLRQAGLRLALARGIFVTHLGNRSISRMPMEERLRTDLANRRLFLRKWLWTDPYRGEVRELFSRTGAPWDNYRPACSVVVPCRGPWERVRQCLDSVRECSEEGTYEVFAMDCAADGETAARLRELCRSWPELWTLESAGPATFSEAMNRAFREAQGDYFVLLDSGAVVCPGWLDGLRRTACDGGKTGLAGPMSDGTPLSWQHFAGPGKPDFDGMAAVLAELAYRGRLAPGTGTGGAPFLSGVALLIPRTVAEKVGAFDERFQWGYEAADYCLRAGQAGFEVRVAGDVFVHRGPDPFDGLDEDRRRENARLLFEKWAGHPAFLAARP